MDWVFGGIMLLGAGYLLVSLLLGNLADGVGDGEFGIILAAAFCAGFGAFGLLGTWSGWSLPVTLIAALGFGYFLGRGAAALLRFVLRQQTENSIEPMSEWVGLPGRATIDSPAGKIGEVMLEGTSHVVRSAAREVNDQPLKRGDVIQVVRVESGLLYVKKKNG
jgi:membrane-bound ClpP family serine protease